MLKAYGEAGVAPRHQMLNATHLSKSYPTPAGELTVLRDVTLSLDAGDAACVMGPSGSGKSTLLYILGGLEPPTSGTVQLDGKDPYALSADALAAFRNHDVGFVLQDHCLLPQCTVLENVLVPTLVGEADATAPDRARTLLDQVGLGSRLHHRPGELSGGEKQRAAIARALIRKPRLLLCDEPTGNLDAETATTVADLLIDLHAQQQAIMILVTHSDALGVALQPPLDDGPRRACRSSGDHADARSLRYYAATNALVVLGVAVAVAVLGGALLVGASVRESLQQIALGRLGATDAIVTSPTFFRTALAADLLADRHRRIGGAAPLIAAGGAVSHEDIASAPPAGSRSTASTIGSAAFTA